MIYKITLLIIIQSFGFIYGQFPIELLPDETSQDNFFSSDINTEYLLSLTALSNTDWSEEGSESSTLTISVDNNWDNYNQDIVLYAGSTSHTYYVSLGPISKGNHTISFKFDHTKSSPNSTFILVESIELIDIKTTEIDLDVFIHSPIIYGRDILAWNESSYTDIPLIMWHEIEQHGTNKHIKYSIIFSNEDSRVGIGLSDLMFNYGRTTDIEWVYEVILNNDGLISSESFQGANHITTIFDGEKIGRHPILKNATLNCNFSDTGSSNYKFFPSPYLTNDNNQTRESLMDQNPWTYRIMAEELINEQRYEDTPDPNTPIISDVRNYLYLEYSGLTSGTNMNLGIGIKFISNCNRYYNHHNYQEFNSSIYYGGLNRTSIELPNNFNPEEIHQLGFIAHNLQNEHTITISNISRLFYLDSNYIPIDIDFEFTNFILTEENFDNWIIINDNFLNLDCMGVENGILECDSCNICGGDDIDVDDCGICFGNNYNMDCSGTCFGNAQEDDCGICDSNSENDNITCSGCTDINALNYNQNAIFNDNSCQYNDRLFYVPLEYNTIQQAISFASDGDTVEVGPGTYYENINFDNKGITIRSTYSDHSDINQYIISGTDSSSVITIENIQTNASILGFTITNGYGRGTSFENFISVAADQDNLDSLLTNVLKAGGITIINSNPYLKDLYIHNNISQNVGAGIGLINSNVIIESSIISNNTILDGDGLGGGGIAINGGSVYLNEVIIKDNVVGTNVYSLNGGGGILCGFPIGNNALQLEMDNITINNNIANIGAGIGALSGIINGNRLLFYENIGAYGSAIALGEPLGLVIGEIEMNLTNSTITNNSGLIGIGMINTSSINAVNSIFWNNGELEFSPLPNNNDLNLNLSHCNTNDIFEGYGNINLNPLFAESSNSFYSLSQNSPCVDAGTNDTNFDGIIDLHVYSGSSPDIGRFEYISSECNLLGDINIDQNINIFDIILVVNCILDECFIQCGDINSDEDINILDIIYMVNFILESQ